LIWSSEKILSIAPDAATARRGEDLGTIRKWRNLEGNTKALWGECKSSGASFYKTQIDLKGPAFKCNCPSRKFPCKHSIGLLFLYINSSEAFRITDEMPSELIEWLENRNNKTESEPKTDEGALEKAKADAAKKYQKRLGSMSSGFEDLEIWLSDLIRQGLATTEGQAYSFWQNISSRMVDSKIGGVGRKLKAIPLLHGSNTKWPEQILAEFSQLYIMAKGFKRLEKLPKLLQTELLTIAGINIQKKDLLPLKGKVDEWKVIGIIEGIDDNLNFRRTWLYGGKTQKAALILDYSFGDAGYDAHWVVGQSFQAELVDYPSSYPLRAIVKENLGNVDFSSQIQGFATLEAFFKHYAKAIASNPWILDFPCLLEGITPFIKNDELFLIDKKKKSISALNKGNKGWKMIALSGGHPITVFGEWSGELFIPLSVVSEDRVLGL
jgi:hypothetical protein